MKNILKNMVIMKKIISIFVIFVGLDNELGQLGKIWVTKDPVVIERWTMVTLLINVVLNIKVYKGIKTGQV